MPREVAIDELSSLAGSELGTSVWFEIDQARVNAFADVTEDHQFIHTNRLKAKLTPFGGTIAHGFLTLSLLTHLTSDISVVPEGTRMGVNYGFDKVRFLQPVRVGRRVRARVTLMSVEERNPGQFLTKSAVTVDIDGEEKPALVAEWLALLVTG